MKGYINTSDKSRARHRLKIIQGQVRGLEKMIENEDYCINILHQSLAIQESLKSFEALILKNHLIVHLAKQLRGRNQKKAVKEMLRLFQLSYRR